MAASPNKPRLPTTALIRNAAPWATPLTLVLAAATLAVPEPWYAIALALLAGPAAFLIVIDLHTHRLPTPLVAAAAIGTTPLLISVLIHDTWNSAGRSIAASAILAVVFFAKFWFTRGGTGLGDVRLAAVLGLYAGWLSWPTVVATVMLAYLLVLPIALMRLIRRRQAPIAFGPALVGGFYLAAALALYTH